MNIRVYVDTSALAALLIEQPESAAVCNWLDHTSAELLSSDLLETELRRIAVRENLSQKDVTMMLDRISLASLDRAVFRAASMMPMPYLRSLDALHLEAAMRLNADAILTYDRRLSEAAAALGYDVISPRDPSE